MTGANQTERSEDWLNQHHKVLMELADCYAEMGQPDTARDYYSRAAALAPGEPGPYVGMGVLAIQAQDPSRAIEAFQTAVQIDPRCSEGWGGLAMVHHQLHSYSAAFQMYLKCLELDTDNLMALLGLFQTSCQMGSFAKIIEYLDLYLQRHPHDTSVLFCLATLYAREGIFDKARSTLSALLAVQPEHQQAAQMLAQISAEMAKPN
ncbi:MAG: tetratricopeptide repeat protein [Planctomycetes bacterium]|nr:tetratricopeptide repeat protein [Planctomycetota bacterium]